MTIEEAEELTRRSGYNVEGAVRSVRSHAVLESKIDE